MTNPVLTIANLTKRFGGVTAVSDINLDVMPKETIAIIGPNGAGKTTFYNMVSGRMQPTEGTIMLDGKDITGLPPHKISRLGVSRSFQINNIFPEMTVQENVEVVLSAYHGHSRKLFNIASRNTEIQNEAVEFLKRLGIDSLKAQRAEVISYGDKRLLEIAMVLATQPKLVLLDEPTAGMTPDETRRTTQLIKQLAGSGDYTFMITEHDMDVVFNLADRILVMHRGEKLFA
ncbi:ABC transporter ATP-binding protein, partial [Marinobacter sp.]